MGLFSSFLKGDGAKKLEEVGKDLLSKALNGELTKPEQNENSAAERQSFRGGSEWDAMPDEENQYSFGGSYKEYFKKVFAEDFPAYAVSEESLNGGRSTVFTFTKDGAVKLKVELMSESSGANAFRKKTLSAGIPYVRFYYDHAGWWNTRSYVANRVRNALGA